MNNKTKSTIIAALLTASIAGCAREPPKCSDEDTITLVRQIIVDQLDNHEGMTDKELQENMRIEFPRASALDEKIKKYSCEAKLIAGGAVELPITYESQLDDKNQHIVSVGGVSRGDLIALQSAITESIKKNRTAREGEASTSSEAATQVQITPAPAPVAERPSTPPLAAAPEPSVDCTKASKFSEQAICSDPLLGKLEAALSGNYKYMLFSDIGQEAKTDLIVTQMKWRVERDNCANKQCLVDAYRKRIDEVCEYPVISGVHPTCASSSEIK